MPKAIRTNLDARMVHEGLLKTFEKWVLFATKRGRLSGKMLKAPSGRMSSAIKAKFDEDGNVVALFFDESELGAEDYEFFTHGHKAFSLKRKMLRLGKPGVKRSKEGYLYKRVTISQKSMSPSETYANSSIKNLFTQKKIPGGNVLQINRNLSRMWATNYKRAHGSGPVLTMTNKPGSAEWRIPAMPAFSVKKLLLEMAGPDLKDRIIL